MVKGGSGGFAPKVNICIPASQFLILLAILFKNVLKMLKISQPVTFVPHHPLTSLRPVAEIWYRVGCNRATCFSHDRGNWRNSAH